ncbi:MAG: arylesterase [Gemmatimonadota bacterium]|nr:arylesterase [Gemmatimonadota bacterium]
MRLLGSVSLLLTLAACNPGSEAPPSAADQGASAPDSQAGDGSRAPSRTIDALSEDTLPVVVFFGTSLTSGMGLQSEDDTYVAHLTELAADAGVPFTAVNAGVSGETSAGGVRRIDWVLQEPLDILVLELGANDGLRGLPVAELRDNLLTIIRRTKERYPAAKIVVLGMEAPPNLGRRYVTSFREVFRDVATREDTYFVPFFLDGVAGVRELNAADGIHPTETGHRRMAENILPELTAALEAASHGTDGEPVAAEGGDGNR